MNGPLHLLIAEGRTDPPFIAAFTEGWDGLRDLVADSPLRAVAVVTGLPEADVRRAAEWIGGAEGMVVNSERNMTLMRKALEPPGGAMPNRQIIARVAQAIRCHEPRGRQRLRRGSSSEREARRGDVY